MIKIIKYMRGYVVIRVWGYSPERFMNLCSNHGILLWDIENHGEYYHMCVSLNGFFRLKACLKKTKTRVAIEKRCGLPFFIPKVKKRKIFGTGFIGCILFLAVMSRFLWAVDIQGNYSVTDDVFMDFLLENGVRCGMPKHRIAIEELETKIREEFDIVTWTSARIDGTKLTIQVKENDHPGQKKEEEPAPGEGKDLTACADGVIVKMITRTGVPLVAPGDSVKKGDILVNGKYPIMNEDGTVRRYEYCLADADVYIQYTYPVREILPVDYKKKAFTGNEKKAYFLQAVQKEYKLPVKVPFLKSDCVIEKHQLHFSNSFYLPLSAGSYTYREYVMMDKKYSPEEAKTILGNKLDKLVKTLEEKGVQIIEKNVKIETDSKNYTLKGSFTVIERSDTTASTEQVPADGVPDVLQEPQDGTLQE